MSSDGKGGQGLGEISGANQGTTPDPIPKSAPDPKQEAGGVSATEDVAGPHHVISVVEEEEEEEKGAAAPDIAAAEAEREERSNVAASKKPCLTRSDSCHDGCRICQQSTEEPLIVLGCRCRGGLAKAHRSCIEMWFHTRGSNKCEICQQVAANVQFPDSQPSTNYWVWRDDSAYAGTIGRGNHERRWFSPLWVAFAILVGGLLLDVLISLSLGVSALPVNIIIGVLIVLGLGTAFRLTVECCQECGSRRDVERVVQVNVNPGIQPTV